MAHPKPGTAKPTVGQTSAPPAAHGLRPLDALGTGAAIVTTIFWGSAGVAARIGAADLPPWTLAALRGWLAFTILALIMLWRRPALPRDRHAWGRAFLIGLLQTAAPMGLLFWAVLHLDTGLAMVLLATQPFFVAAFLLRWSGGEHVSRVRVLALVLGFAGVAVVAYAKTSSTPRFDWFALVAMVIAALSWAAGTLLMRRPGWGDVPLLVTVQMAFGSVALTLVAAFEWTQPLHVTPVAVLSLIYLAVFATVLVFLLWFWLVQRHGAGRVSPFIFIMPLSGVLLGALLLGEPLPPLLFPGLALVALGLILVHLPDDILRRVS